MGIRKEYFGCGKKFPYNGICFFVNDKGCVACLQRAFGLDQSLWKCGYMLSGKIRWAQPTTRALITIPKGYHKQREED